MGSTVTSNFVKSVSEGASFRRNILAFEVAIAEGSSAVAQAAPAWEAIEEADGIATPFQSLAVGRATATAHLARGEQPRIVIVREHGRPLVIFPTVVGRCAGVSTVRFLGDPFIQYGDAIVAPEALPAHIEAAWTAAVDSRVSSVGFFRKVRADSPIATMLARNATTTAVGQAPYVDLPVAQKPNSRHAREVRRLRRRLAERGELRFELMDGAAGAAVLRETLELKRAWLAERGLPSTVFGNPEWEDVLFELNAGSCGRAETMAARLTVSGQTAATEIGFVYGRSWFAYIGALAPQFAQSGPGHVLMDEIMAWCGASGRKVYDLLPPSQPYKNVLATDAVPVRDYAIASDFFGQAALLAAHLIPVAKKLVAATPLQIRRRLVRLQFNAASKQ